MRRIVLWGTGARARDVLSWLDRSRTDIVAFVDNDAAKQGEFFGRPVYPPEKLPELDYDGLFIASVFYDSIVDQTRRMGIPQDIVFPSAALSFMQQAAHLTEEQLTALVSIPFWYHSFEILRGVKTPGICDYKPHLVRHRELAEVSGKKVLDIGAWDGAYTLEMSRRGAHVTGFDIQPPDHCAFGTTCRLNGITATHICANVYDLCPDRHGLFDIVLFFGVYYHLKNPLLAFENINAVLPVGGLLVFEGAILEGAPKVDAYWHEHADILPTVCATPYAYYVKDTYEGEWSNWWVPDLLCLRQWLESSGFAVIRMGTAEENARGYGIARKVAPVGEEHMVLPAHGS